MLKNPKKILLIAAHDSAGISGISADVRTCYAHHIYPIPTITALTTQDTHNVYNISAVATEILLRQIDISIKEFKPSVVKIGLVTDGHTLVKIIEKLSSHKLDFILWDPVINASTGKNFLQQTTEEFSKIVKNHLSRISMITPNLNEALALFTSTTVTINPKNLLMLMKAAKVKYPVLTGGHIDDGKFVIDRMLINNKVIEVKKQKINTQNLRSTGCTFSTAVACLVAKGLNVPHAFESASMFVNNSIRNNFKPGTGKGMVWQL